MNLLSEIKAAVTGCGLSVETGVFSGEPPEEYVVVTPLADTYVWNRIPRKDRLLLGTLFLNHVSKMNGNLKAIEKISSNQERNKKTIDKF